LFLVRQLDHLDALLAAALFHLFGTLIALYKEQMTGLVCAVGMRIAGLTALVAIRNDIFGYPLATPVVEYKILPEEFVLQAFFLHLPGIFDDTALKLENILKAFMLVIGAGLFTADPPSAIHYQVPVFLVILKVLFDYWK